MAYDVWGDADDWFDLISPILREAREYRKSVSGSPPKGEDAQGASEGEAGQSGPEGATPQNPSEGGEK